MNHLLHRNTLVTGTVLLTAAGLLSRVIGFFYKIFLSRTIGAEGLGIYQLLFPVMALCFSLTSAGIQTAISKCVAEESGVPTPARARLYLYCGLLFSVSLSLLLGVFLWNYATWISAFFLGDLRCAPLLRILAFSYIPCSIHSCINGYYYGLKKSLVPSLSQLAEQCARVGGVYLIYLILQEKGMGITVSAAVWGIFFGEFAGMLVSLSAMGCGKWEGSISSSAKALLQMAFPVTANRLFLTLFSGVENLLIPRQLRLFGYTQKEALSIYGILTGMALSVILFPTVLTNSVSVLLLPTISQAKASHNTARIHRAVRATVECCLALGLLCTVMLLLFGSFIGNRIFKNSLSGTFILTLSWICPFLYLGSTLNSIFHGLGKPLTTLLLNLSACGIRILFIFFLIPAVGIRGYLTGLLVSQIVSCSAALFLLYRCAS